MKSINEKLLSESIAHEIDTLGYGNYLSKKIIAILNNSDTTIYEKLFQVLETIPKDTISVAKIDKTLKVIYDINDTAYQSVSKTLNKQLLGFTEQELNYQTNLLNDVQPVKVVILTPETVFAGAMAQPFQGQLLKETLKGLSTQKANIIRDAVRTGFIEGQTTSQIIKVIRGTRELKYNDGIMNITRRNAEAVVLTALAHTQNYAQETLYKENSDIIKGYRYTATLDTRTTELCASRDGNFYKMGQPKPAIPAHYRCRSRYVPVVKSFKELGINISEIPPSTRASMDGQVPEKMTYQDWLKKQSFERQIKVLGKQKAELFKDGKLTLNKFVSPSGHVYTLKELETLNNISLN